VIARLERQSKMGLINKSLSGIVKNLGVALKNAPLDKIVVVSIVHGCFFDRATIPESFPLACNIADYGYI